MQTDHLMSILTLALMVVLVATTRPAGGKPRTKKPATGKGDTIKLGPGVKLGPAVQDPERPGVVSYRLMQDKKLPSQSQRVMRRVWRPISGLSGWFARKTGRSSTGGVSGKIERRTGQSVELQNFLDARNQEIARRKSEPDGKRGPDETLH
jgi:hypothetical protein